MRESGGGGGASASGGGGGDGGRINGSGGGAGGWPLAKPVITTSAMMCDGNAHASISHVSLQCFSEWDELQKT